ncbi:ArsR/SmtB family transcription factor [Alkalispirochaeta alkalica]|uniref:ArsR/SmtB family transcription factor n=1 Tax=Alkalispirochaeta alkalica TaxID=46356 RepID=UPI0009FCE661|nr:metalloregulator ArsR/SmtB family transcription factor [Alkalispirochaeta alkalica]
MSSYSDSGTAGCCSDESVDRCAEKLKVCGHPMRLRLLCRIARGEEACVSELWTCLGQPQPVVSQHLAALKQKGVVESEVRGNRRVYRIIDPFIENLIFALQAGIIAPDKTPGSWRSDPTGSDQSGSDQSASHQSDNDTPDSLPAEPALAKSCC